jgi:hypothetical protein
VIENIFFITFNWFRFKMNFVESFWRERRSQVNFRIKRVVGKNSITFWFKFSERREYWVITRWTTKRTTKTTFKSQTQETAVNQIKWRLKIKLLLDGEFIRTSCIMSSVASADIWMNQNDGKFVKNVRICYHWWRRKNKTIDLIQKEYSWFFKTLCETR